MAPPLYTARTHVVAGRDGSARTDDGLLDVRLGFPKALGGDASGTNPEQLFASGWAACFGSSLRFVAGAEGVGLRDVTVDAEVDLLKGDGGYDLAARLRVHAEGAPRPTLEALIEKAKRVCAYSRATRGNVPVTIELV